METPTAKLAVSSWPNATQLAKAVKIVAMVLLYFLSRLSANL